MPIMIQVSELSLSDAEGRQIFRDLHFRLNRGEWGCISGPQGSGKTAFLRLLTGQCRPDQGQILVDERNILRINPEKLRLLRRRLGVVLEGQALTGARTLRGTHILKLRALDASPEEAAERAETALELVGLRDKADQPLSALSPCDRQLFILGLALNHDPVLLLLDGPLQEITSNQEKQRFLEVLEKIHLRKRLTTLITAGHGQLPRIASILHYDLAEGKISERKPMAVATDGGDLS